MAKATNTSHSQILLGYARLQHATYVLAAQRDNLDNVYRPIPIRHGAVCFRQSFNGAYPPLRYTEIEIVEDTIKQISSNQLSPSQIPTTMISNQDLETMIFNMLPIASENYNLSIPLERDYDAQSFISTVMRADYLFKVRTLVMSGDQSLICRASSKPLREVPGIGFVPTSAKQMMIHFEPIVWNESPTAEKYYRWQLIVKTVVENASPFITVCIADTLDVQLRLALALPFGNRNRGNEIFINKESNVGECKPSDISEENYYRIQYPDHRPVFISKATGIISSSPNKQTRVGQVTSLHPLNNPDKYLVTSPPPGKTWHSVSRNLAYLAYMYDEETTGGYFERGAVVYGESHNTPFDTYDFSNYYATVMSVFGIDHFITKVLSVLMLYRKDCPLLKFVIVTLLGKLKHHDVAKYNYMKNLSVAVMLSTISMNPEGSIMGATTDGIQVTKGHVLKHPALFSVKKEFSFARVVHKTVNHFVGIMDDQTIVHRGVVGRGCDSAPEWYKKVVDFIVRKTLGGSIMNANSVDFETVAAEFKSHIKPFITDENDEVDIVKLFFLPDLIEPSVSPVIEHKIGAEWITNDCILHKFRIYTVIDQNITDVYNNIKAPEVLNALSSKYINCTKYVEVLDEKIMSLINVFGNRSDTDNCVRDEEDSDEITFVKTICKIVRNSAVDIMKNVAPKGFDIYPGAFYSEPDKAYRLS